MTGWEKTGRFKTNHRPKYLSLGYFVLMKRLIASKIHARTSIAVFECELVQYWICCVQYYLHAYTQHIYKWNNSYFGNKRIRHFVLVIIPLVLLHLFIAFVVHTRICCDAAVSRSLLSSVKGGRARARKKNVGMKWKSADEGEESERGLEGYEWPRYGHRIMTSVMRDAIIAGKRRPGHRQKYYLWLRGGWAQIVILLAIVKYSRRGSAVFAPKPSCTNCVTMPWHKILMKNAWFIDAT